MTRKSQVLLQLALCIALFAAHGAAFSQAYPNKPVKIVLSFGPGSATDMVTRVYADALRVAFKQPFLIEHKAGASARIGTEFVARAAPDGYTLLVGSNTSHSANPYLFKKLNYDPIKDFTPISNLIQFTSVLVVDPNLPVKSVQELLAYAKADPKKVSCAYGNTSAQITCATLFRRAGIEILHVPYKTNQLAIADILSGNVSMNFVDLATASPLIMAGKLRCLAVAKAARSRLIPDVPTVAETPGMAGFDNPSWIGLFGPAGMPRPIVDALSSAIQRIAANPENKERFAKFSAELQASTPEEFGKFVAWQLENWGHRIKELGIEPE